MIQQANVAAPPYVGPLGDIVTEIEYRIKERQDWVRSVTTYAFIAIFGLTVVFSFVILIFASSAWANTKEFIQLILPAESALIGSAVGFYFGSRTDSAGSP